MIAERSIYVKILMERSTRSLGGRGLPIRRYWLNASNGADLAPAVDRVLAEQMKRLRAYAAGAPKSR